MQRNRGKLAAFFEIVFQGWQNTYAISVVKSLDANLFASF